jgi:cell division protein ZapA (FtsZ GTPase activity inhibitor)
MMTTLIHTFTIAMSSPHSADVSLHLERCKNPVINIRPMKLIVSLQCDNYQLTVDCTDSKKTNIKSLTNKENMYLGHIECRRSK